VSTFIVILEAQMRKNDAGFQALKLIKKAC